MAAKLKALRGSATTRPAGLYWMRSYATGAEFQLRAEEIVMAERLDGQEGITVLWLSHGVPDRRILVAEELGRLYDRPVIAGETARRD